MEKRFCFVTLAVALVFVAEAPLLANDNLSRLDRQFVTKIWQRTKSEVVISEAALQKSKSVKVRKTAQLVLSQDIKMLQELKQVAHMLKIDLPEVGKEQFAMQDFDRLYAGALLSQRRGSLALFNQVRGIGKDVQVKKFAAKYQPLLQKQTQLLTALARSFGVEQTHMMSGVPAAPAPPH